MCVCAKFEGWAGKTVGGVGFLKLKGFSKTALLPNFASRLPVWLYWPQLGKDVDKWSMMLYYKFVKVWQSILDVTAFLM